MDLSTKELVSELDKKIIGQDEAKRTIAIAVRNRWRRTQLKREISRQITPKNILLVGSTGVGKTAIVRATSELIDAPFLKVESTRYTQLGYVGECVTSMISDLVEIAKKKIDGDYERSRSLKKPLAFKATEEELSEFLKTLSKRIGDFFNREFNELADIYGEKKIDSYKSVVSQLDSRIADVDDRNKIAILMLHDRVIPNELNSTTNRFDSKRDLMKTIFISTVEVNSKLFNCFDEDKFKDFKGKRNLKEYVENYGIIFIDEIDKIAEVKNGGHDNVGKIGVQRDLLPLLDGAEINTPYGKINTENILFIAAGAFHVSEVTNLMPELLGRLPIRIDLESMSKEMMESILKNTIDSPIRQYEHLLSVDGVKLTVTEGAIKRMALIADEINSNVYSLGARTLHAVVEKVFSKVSYEAYRESDSKDTQVVEISEDYIKKIFD